MTVGARIKQAREAKGLSRPQLSERSGVPYPTLAGLENGDQKESTKLHALATALGVSVQWLATGKEGRPSPEAAGALAGEASNSVRLRPEIIVAVSRVMNTVYGLIGHTVDLSERSTAELFAAAYEWRASMDDEQDADVSLTARVINFMNAREARDGGKQRGSDVGGVQEGARRKGVA